MKVFLTGATGFIGAHVARRLAGAGHEMRCLVRKRSRARELEELGASLIIGDVRARDPMLGGMKGCDWAINLANLYSFWEPDRRTYTGVNVEGTRSVMECALEAGVSKVVHVSTAAVYGKPADSPFTEASPVGPERFSEYSRTKYEGDLVAWGLYEKKGLPLVMVYPGAVLGPGDPKPTGRYIEAFVHRRIGATAFADTVFTFVDVRDVAEAIARAAEKEGNIGEKYLVGKHQLSMRELNLMMGEISGVPPPRIGLPDSLVRVAAALLTFLADLTKKPPSAMGGLCADQVRMMRAGIIFDGSKAERELALTYTPIRSTLEEAVASYRVR